MKWTSGILWLGLAAGGVQAADGEASLALEKVQAWLSGTVTLHGQFSQELVSGALGGGLEERGRFWIERPGRMRWDYLEPEKKVAIVVDDETTLYLEEEAQLFLGRLDNDGKLLPALLAGERSLVELFEPSLMEPDGAVEPGRRRLRLVALGGSEAFEQLVITAAGPEHAIEAAEVLDAAGNRVFYRFSGLKRNSALPDGLFRLDPPPGTDIVEDR